MASATTMMDSRDMGGKELSPIRDVPGMPRGRMLSNPGANNQTMNKMRTGSAGSAVGLPSSKGYQGPIIRS